MRVACAAETDGNAAGRERELLVQGATIHFQFGLNPREAIRGPRRASRAAQRIGVVPTAASQGVADGRDPSPARPGRAGTR
jgi:hypothetical protein